MYFRYFDFMGLGDYILYRNTERNFEVRNVFLQEQLDRAMTSKRHWDFPRGHTERTEFTSHASTTRRRFLVVNKVQSSPHVDEFCF